MAFQLLLLLAFQLLATNRKREVNHQHAFRISLLIRIIKDMNRQTNPCKIIIYKKTDKSHIKWQRLVQQLTTDDTRSDKKS